MELNAETENRLTWLDGHGDDDVVGVEAVALEVEQHVGQLAAGIRAVDVVVLHHGDVVEVELSLQVGVRHDVDDAARGALAQLVFEQPRQVEVAEVVDAERPLDAVVGGRPRSHVGWKKGKTEDALKVFSYLLQ